MQLNETETIMLKRLQNAQRSWPRTRWILLTIGIVGLALWGYFFFHVINTLRAKWSNENLPVVILLYPWCLIMLHLSCAVTIYALANWYGNAKDILLLKLLGAKES